MFKLTLTEKVKEILIELGEKELAGSMQVINYLANKFYEHYEKELKNHIPIKRFIESELLTRKISMFQ